MDSLNNACKLGSDAWLELQAFKTRQLNRREKLNRHKSLQQGLITTQNTYTISNANQSNQPAYPSTSGQPCYIAGPSNLAESPTRADNNIYHNNNDYQLLDDKRSGSANINNGPEFNTSSTDNTTHHGQHSEDSYEVATCIIDPESHLNFDLVECLLILKLCDVALKLPVDSRSLQRSINRVKNLESTSQSVIENLLQKFAHQELITIEEPTTALLKRQRTNSLSSVKINDEDDETCIYVTSADHTKLVEFDKSFGAHDNLRSLLVESKVDECLDPEHLNLVQPTSSSIIEDRKSFDAQKSTGPSNSTQIKRTDSGSNITTTDKKSSYDTSRKQREFIDGKEDVESLLSLASTREKESKKLGEELLELLSKPTAKERNLLESFRSADGYQVQEFCPKGTKGECARHNNGIGSCDKLHFKKIIAKHTEESLGDCSFLNTCFHMDSCKYVHYEVDYDGEDRQQRRQFKKPQSTSKIDGSMQSTPAGSLNGQQSLVDKSSRANSNNRPQLPNQSGLPSSSISNCTLNTVEEQAKNRKRFKTVLYPPQWIQCDLRFFDMSLLGKFSVIMADPPWDIHMELPYGTMSDDEMRALNIPALQDEGVIFLWVTGRAMELGRECLSLWGYERCDEIIWVKTNQLQRIIRTGRTGHWLNHGKEHCLVGLKGNPKDINRGLDCDVIVAEVRATSHKPDEIYGIIERLSPGTRKIELFGREHNVQPNWITLGNQLNGVRLVEPSLVNAFKKLNLPFQSPTVAADHQAG